MKNSKEASAKCRSSISRRTFMQRAGALATLSVPALASSRQVQHQGRQTSAKKSGALVNTYVNILRAPDRVTVFTAEKEKELKPAGGVQWRDEDIEVTTEAQQQALPILVRAPRTGLLRLRLRWQAVNLSKELHYLGDHWERGYGDLEWRGLIPERVMPWYFHASDGRLTHSYGVRTGAHAIAFWQADASGITLWLDVRCGGGPVQLGERLLPAATVVTQEGREGLSAFHSAQAFCHLMCDRPRPLKLPVYGANDWYYAYGSSTAKDILRDAQLISELSPNSGNRPYVVIDDGWQVNAGTVSGPWHLSNRKFPDMPGLAHQIKELNAHPGIWIRPLATQENTPSEWLLSAKRFPIEVNGYRSHILDPTVPEALNHVAEDINRLRQWGYEIIKHDFSTYDIFGKWGFQMGVQLTSDKWRFADAGKTTAEALGDLYQTIRRAAGDALIIGCNTIGHLSAGLFELQRTGDDTSGRDWNRTRKMGVNTLAFRMPQHKTFFASDADCVGLTRKIPWELNRQWLDLLSRSGTPLFVSLAPDALGEEQRKALITAFELAANTQPSGEPLNWMETTTPDKWLLNGKEVTYDWYGTDGASPFS